jgi:uncharacterized membrane protein YphA (DoxX/SURF4 family)
MTDETATDEADESKPPCRVGRLFVGLGLALQASEDFRDMESTVDYAESAGVPVPELLAPLASLSMFLGGLGVAFWRLPRLSTAAVTGFLAVVTPTMHDFWNADEDSKEGERLAFFGNLTMFGAALVFLREAYRRD